MIKVSILILKFAIIYGLYEIFAKNFGLPLFLNWIANNNSFTIVDNSQGWIKIARIRSFWSEPSMSAWPIIVFLFFNWKYSKRSYYTILWHLLAGIYSLFTLSRIVILIYVLTTLLIVLWTFAQKITVGGHYLKKVLLLEKKVFQIGLVSFTFLLFSLWPFYSKIIFDDLSASGRSNSIMIGYYIWLDNPLLGTGFNSYKRFDENYRFKVSNYQDEPISQSEFSSYLQQMGILGLFFIVLIGALIYLFSKYSSFDRFLILLLYAVFCSVAVGVFYFSIFWFFLAVLISNDKTYKYK